MTLFGKYQHWNSWIFRFFCWGSPTPMNRQSQWHGKKSIHGSSRWAKHVPSWTWQPPKLQPRYLYKLAPLHYRPTRTSKKHQHPCHINQTIIKQYVLSCFLHKWWVSSNFPISYRFSLLFPPPFGDPSPVLQVAMQRWWDRQCPTRYYNLPRGEAVGLRCFPGT